jgi:hypothetical protein
MLLISCGNRKSETGQKKSLKKEIQSENIENNFDRSDRLSLNNLSDFSGKSNALSTIEDNNNNINSNVTKVKEDSEFTFSRLVDLIVSQSTNWSEEYIKFIAQADIEKINEEFLTRKLEKEFEYTDYSTSISQMRGLNLIIREDIFSYATYLFGSNPKSEGNVLENGLTILINKCFESKVISEKYYEDFLTFSLLSGVNYIMIKDNIKHKDKKIYFNTKLKLDIFNENVNNMDKILNASLYLLSSKKIGTINNIIKHGIKRFSDQNIKDSLSTYSDQNLKKISAVIERS